MTRRTAQNADLANMAQATIKGRAAGAGTGVPVDLTAAEVNTIIGGGSGITQLTSDVTAGPGSGSQAATIANSAVTLAKMANLTGPSIIGMVSGTAAPIALTPAQVRTIDGTAEITLDPTGFSDPSAVVVTYSSAAQTITLTGTWVAYWRGQVVTALTAGWVSDPHPNVTGHIYRLYYDGASYTWLDNTQWPSFNVMMIASVNYGATDKYGVRECHGLMNWQAHEVLHETIGTFRETGGVLGSWVANSTTAGNRRPTVTACTIHDEDIITVNAALTSDTYTQMFIPAGATATTDFTLAAAEIVPVLAANPYYNQFTSGLWKQTLMAKDRYMCVWLVEMPVTADAGSQAYRHAWVQGQTNGNLASQTALTPSDLNLGSLNNDATEFVFIAKVIIQFTDDNWVITSVTNLTGNKFIQVGNPAGVYLSTVAVDATLTGDGTLGSPLSTLGIANRVMAQNITLANGYCWILSGYVDTVTYTITLDGDARLEVI